MATLASLVDAFDGSTINAQWEVAGTASLTGSGQLSVQGVTALSSSPANFLKSSSTRSNSDFVTKIDWANSTARPVLFVGQFDSGIYKGWTIEKFSATQIRVARYNGSTATNLATVTTTDPWWKVTLSANSPYVVFATSADGVTYTTRASVTTVPTSIDLTFWDVDSATSKNVFLYGIGTAGVALFDSTNTAPPPSVTSNAAVVATSSNKSYAPALKQSFAADVATLSSLAQVPDLKQSVAAVLATSLAAVPVPAFAERLNSSMAAPQAVAGGSLLVPDVLTPFPTSVSAPQATASGSFPAPAASAVQNTSVAAPQASASAAMLPPGEYIRLTPGPATASITLQEPLRAGAVLSRYGSTVVQTPKNTGGAVAYYRLSDANDVLTDVLGQNHGAWVGPHPVVAGALADDLDAGGTFFNGTSTRAAIGGLPDMNYPRDDPGTLSGNVDPWSGSSQYFSGATLVIWVKTPIGSVKTGRIVHRGGDFASRPDVQMNADGTVRYSMTGSDQARTTYQVNSTQAINDGSWHMLAFTTGRDYTDETPAGAGVMKVYVDGALSASATCPPGILWTDDVVIGNLGTGFFEGSLDELSFHDVALSRWQILELWNQGKNLTGPPLYQSARLATLAVTTPSPRVRFSPVIPLNDFYDDFTSPILDREKWRDASPGVQVIAGELILKNNLSQQALTPDYFQAKDSSFIVKVDKLPLKTGTIDLLLVNEEDIVPDWVFGGPQGPLPGHPHREIGFRIRREQNQGVTRTYLTFILNDQGSDGSKLRQSEISYIPDDPNHPSPMKWLKLDIDPGASGGATWYTSPDGVTWTDQYDVHGGNVNASTNTTLEAGPDGSYLPVTTTTYTFEDSSTFRLFNERVGGQPWRGYMRVKLRAYGNDLAGAQVELDNVNVLPAGTGTDVECSVSPALIRTTTTTEYLEFALSPYVYSSATDRQLEVPVARASAKMLPSLLPVKIDVETGLAQGTAVAPERGGQAVPVSVAQGAPGAVVGTMPAPVYAGDALPVSVNAPAAGGLALLVAPTAVFTDESKPAPIKKAQLKTLSLTTRPVLVGVTQN